MCVWVATAVIVAAASAMPMTGTIDEASILANGGDPASQETKDVRALSLFASCLLLIHILSPTPNSQQCLHIVPPPTTSPVYDRAHPSPGIENQCEIWP